MKKYKLFFNNTNSETESTITNEKQNSLESFSIRLEQQKKESANLKIGQLKLSSLRTTKTEGNLTETKGPVGPTYATST